MCEYCFSLRADGLAGENAGLPGQTDDPLDLVRQAERSGVAEGDGQHVGCGVLVSGPGQHIRSGDPLDDPPLRGGWPVTGCQAFCKVDGLASPAGGKQPAEANLPDGEPAEQDFVPRRGFQSLDALPGDRVEQLCLPGLGGGPGEQDQPGTAAAGVVINLQGLPQPDNARCDMTGFAEFVAVHAQYGREQFPVAEVPGDAQRPAGPPGGGGQLFLRQQVAERDPRRTPRA